MGKTKINFEELARLYQLDGRVKAVQDYVTKSDYVKVNDVLDILGIRQITPEQQISFAEILEDTDA